MRYSKIPTLAIAGFPLLLSACASTLSPALTAPKAGFAPVASTTSAAIGKTAVWAQSQGESEALARQVKALAQGRNISADTAVQIALLNNKGLQAAYADVGLSAADLWQQSLRENPVASVGLLGLGAPELVLLRAIETMVAVNLLDGKTRATRVELAEIRLRQAQLVAVEKTLRLAQETRAAWINSVSAFEVSAQISRAAATADAASELALKLGETGALNKAGQAREHVFLAEVSGQSAEARLNANLAKEELTRLMGLWGRDVSYTVPDALPALPTGVTARATIERDALRNRVDLQIAVLELQATAKQFRLTDATRVVSDLEVIAGIELEKESRGDIAATGQVEVEFAIPIFDSGKARLRKAELAYLQAANTLAEKAVNIRSEVRSAQSAYLGRYQIARHYRDVVLPLRRKINEESLLSYNGMITNTFELLSDAREGMGSAVQAVSAKRDFWLAQAALGAAIYGGAGPVEGAGGAMVVAAGASGGH